MKKKNEALTKREALILAWKNRGAYKGYDRSKGSSYNSWRAIRYTAKGKDVGSPEGWSSYQTFMTEVQGDWARGKIACRLDVAQPHSKKNTFWAEKGEERSAGFIRLEYGGESKTLLEWSVQFKLSYNGVRQRFYKGKGYTAEEILFGKIRKVKEKRERTNAHRTSAQVCQYRVRDRNKGMHNDLTVAYFREVIKDGCVYCGDTNRMGLDRILNGKGHEKSNVVPCCYDCNCARMDNFSFAEMKIIGAAIREVKKLRHENK